MKTKAHWRAPASNAPRRNATHATRPLATHGIAVSHHARCEARYYPSAGHDEALARLEYLVEARRRLGVLLGESGIGKSLVLQVAAERLARKGAAVAVVDTVGVGTRDLLWQLAAALGAARAIRPTWSTSGDSWPTALPRTACKESIRYYWWTTPDKPGQT